MMGPETRQSNLARLHKPATDPPDLQQKCLRLSEALKDLYELLEEYSPAWYTEEHHEKARAALDLKPKRHPRK